MIRSLWRTLLFLWLASVLLIIGLPWSKFDGTPHWDNIQWLPFAHLSFNPTVLIEIGANFLIFIPLGYLVVRSFSPDTRHPLLLASLMGFLFSASIEFYQLFCHDRIPSTTDLLTNGGGTVFGARLALGVDQLLKRWMAWLHQCSS
jgi:glycopeptide antibiotics resistance protein